MGIDWSKYPNAQKGHNYALDVVSGKVVACKYVIGACQRYLKDLETKEFPFYPEHPEKFLRTTQRFAHIKGTWSTPNIVYEPWQCFIYINILGFYDNRTGHRRYRTAHVEVPRGSGKSVLASTLALYFLALDNPVGNEISCFATKSDQARIVLDTSRAMARGNPSFLKATKTEVLAHSIKHDLSNSVMRSRSSDHGSLDGLSDILSIVDELHAVSRELFDVVISGMNKRKDSLLFCITTAGFDMDGVGYSQSTYAKKVSTQEVEDDQFFAIVYTIDEGDDIFDETSWKKANPNYGISVDPINFESKAKKAKITPSDLPNFKVKMLNIWLSEAKAYYEPAKWELCAKPDLRLEDFKGKKCKLGVDIASKIDLTSIGYLFYENGIYHFFDRSYIPEATVRKVSSVLYDNCIANGHLIQTKGEVIDQDQIRDQILKDAKDFKIDEVLCDPWNTLNLMKQLENERLNVTEFKMNVANLSEPTKTLDVLMRTNKIFHNGSPLLKWAIGNVIAKEDNNANVFPKKSHERLKIDPIISLLMALASWLQDTKKQSVYESRGITFF